MPLLGEFLLLAVVDPLAKFNERSSFIHSRNIEEVKNLQTDRQTDTVQIPCTVPAIKILPATPTSWRGR